VRIHPHAFHPQAEISVVSPPSLIQTASQCGHSRMCATNPARNGLAMMHRADGA